jgi:hypothetical protein
VPLTIFVSAIERPFFIWEPTSGSVPSNFADAFAFPVRQATTYEQFEDVRLNVHCAHWVNAPNANGYLGGKTQKVRSGAFKCILFRIGCRYVPCFAK